MKMKILIAGAASVMLAAATLPAVAGNNLLGDRVEPTAASRTVVIGADTAYVNVTGGDVVKFVVGDKTFAWAFNGPSNIGEIDLNKIAPAGALDHAVKVYVARNVTTDGG
ncbi:MAG: CzcE family metal-binding protein [Burkholderiaceae bacterium]|nr:CzcE family metal-binding protein [Burkholderiaceae bacterium]